MLSQQQMGPCHRLHPLQIQQKFLFSHCPPPTLAADTWRDELFSQVMMPFNKWGD